MGSGFYLGLGESLGGGVEPAAVGGDFFPFQPSSHCGMALLEGEEKSLVVGVSCFNERLHT